MVTGDHTTEYRYVSRAVWVTRLGIKGGRLVSVEESTLETANGLESSLVAEG